jgi:peroxiredoxin Q/BCP
MLDVGNAAPDFTLHDQNEKPISLSSYRGKPVVVYFYPKADTPGCTKEACAFRDARKEYEKAGAIVLGISPDPVKALKKFADKYELNFTLLADPDHAVAESYGVWVEKSMYGKKYMGIERSTFVIGKDGKIAKIFPKVKVDGHADEVLAAIRAQ